MILNIITPCFKEKKSLIYRNLDSVKKQNLSSLNYRQIVLFDGIDRNDLDNLKFTKNKNVFFFKLRNNHDDYGDYARKIGSKISILSKASAITFLDADNYIEENHLDEILKCHQRTKKNIIISNRFLVDSFKNRIKEKKQNFFDTNSMTFFNDLVKVGLLWSRYPKQLSLIGDRIITNYIKNYHANDIAFTNKNTVNYIYSKIPRKKVQSFKIWYERDYDKYKPKFKKVFGFDLQIK